MPNNLKMTSEKIATAARMYERMATYEDISAAIGVSKTCVLEALRKHGVKSRSRGNQPKLNHSVVKKMIRMYEGGASSRFIGEEVGVHQMTVLRYLRRNGVDTSRDKNRAQRISRTMLSMNI